MNVNLEAGAWGSGLGAWCLVPGVWVAARVRAWGFAAWAYVLRAKRNAFISLVFRFCFSMRYVLYAMCYVLCTV